MATTAAGWSYHWLAMGSYSLNGLLEGEGVGNLPHLAILLRPGITLCPTAKCCITPSSMCSFLQAPDGMSGQELLLTEWMQLLLMCHVAQLLLQWIHSSIFRTAFFNAHIPDCIPVGHWQ